MTKSMNEMEIHKKLRSYKKEKGKKRSSLILSQCEESLVVYKSDKEKVQEIGRLQTAELKYMAQLCLRLKAPLWVTTVTPASFHETFFR